MLKIDKCLVDSDLLDSKNTLEFSAVFRYFRNCSLVAQLAHILVLLEMNMERIRLLTIITSYSVIMAHKVDVTSLSSFVVRLSTYIVNNK